MLRAEAHRQLQRWAVSPGRTRNVVQREFSPLLFSRLHLYSMSNLVLGNPFGAQCCQPCPVGISQHHHRCAGLLNKGPTLTQQLHLTRLCMMRWGKLRKMFCHYSSFFLLLSPSPGPIHPLAISISTGRAEHHSMDPTPLPATAAIQTAEVKLG